MLKVGSLYQRIDPMCGSIRTSSGIYIIKLHDIVVVLNYIGKKDNCDEWQVLSTTGEFGVYTINSTLIPMLWKELA